MLISLMTLIFFFLRFFVCCAGSGLCGEMIIPSEEFCFVCVCVCVSVCLCVTVRDLETSTFRRPSPVVGMLRH